MNPQPSPSAGPTGAPRTLSDSLAAAYGPKAPVGNIVRVAVRGPGALLDLSLKPLSKLETLISSTVKKVIEKQGEKENYKIVLNENREGLADLHFLDEQGNLLGRAEKAALLRLVATGVAGQYRIIELRDRAKQEIPVPSPRKAEKPPRETAEPAKVSSGRGAVVFEDLEAPPEPVKETTPARRAAEQALRGTGAEAAKRAIEQSMTSQAKAKETGEKKIRPDAAMEGEMESLLQKKHRYVVAARLKDEKQRGNVNAEITWASKMLDTVKSHRRKPGNESKPLLCELLTNTINPANTVPRDLRTSVVAFCEEVADKAKGKVAQFAEQILEEFGWRQREEKIEAMYQNATLQQILQRLEPDKPIDVQNKGLRQLNDFVHRQAVALRRVADQGRRNQIAGECTAAMQHAATTRAYFALGALERKDLNTSFTRVKERLNRGLPQANRKPPGK